MSRIAVRPTSVHTGSMISFSSPALGRALVGLLVVTSASCSHSAARRATEPAAAAAVSSASGTPSRPAPATAPVVSPNATVKDPQVGPAAVVDPADWPTYHHGNYRAGVGSGVPPVTSGLTRISNVTLDGAVYASPITARSYKILATENNTVYRVAGNTVVWSRHLGTPVPGGELPCGNINPSGITSTPVYDSATSTVVVVALLDHPIRHVAYGLEPQTGLLRWSRTVDVPTSVPGISPAAMQQRGALLDHAGKVYIAYGGLAGDCSSYRGSVVTLDLNHPVTGALGHFTVPTSREGGIWASPGPSTSPAGGVLVAVGNGATAGTGTYDHSDSILRLGGTTMLDSFSPSTWRDDNQQDLDLGSQGPTAIGKWVFIAGKRGTAYVLDGAHLGGIGGQVSQMSLCRSFGGTAASGSVVYVPCADGLRAVRINSNGTMTVLWHAASSITGSPVIGGGRIWSLDTGQGVLYALDPATGAAKGHWSVGAVTRFTTPALWRNTIVIGTRSGVVAFSWS